MNNYTNKDIYGQKFHTRSRSKQAESDMNAYSITSMDELKTILHGEPKSEQQQVVESYAYQFKKLRYLHQIAGERIVELEDTINQQKSDRLVSIATVKLEIELKKVLTVANEMKRIVRTHRDHTFNLYILAGKTEEAREQSKQRLIEKIGEEDAAKLTDAITNSLRPNEKWTEAQESIKQKYSKYIK